jgi:hypothetical protein
MAKEKEHKEKKRKHEEDDCECSHKTLMLRFFSLSIYHA